MLGRLFALVILAALVGGGLYYWKYRGAGLPELGIVGRELRDTATTGAVTAALELHRGLAPHAIRASSERGVVTLRGEVPTEDLKETAAAVARAVPDVIQVVNHLRIVPARPAGPTGRSIGESLDDHALAAKVRLAFTLHRDLKGTDVAVSAYQRAVTLSGEVDTPGQRQTAVDVARETVGVAEVRDGIRVKSAAGARGDVGRAAERALAANPNLTAYRLKVGRAGGAWVLTGRVRTGAEKDLAGLVAQGATGAVVDNHIEIRP